jgi:competence protein ComEC
MHVADSNSSKSTMPLFHAAWLFGCGIAAAHFLWLRPSLLLAALLPMAAICVLAAVCARRIVWAPLGVLWMMLGAWCAQMEPQPAADRDLATLSDGLLRTVEGTVVDTGPVRAEREQNVDEPSPVAPAERIDLRLSSVEIVTDDADFESPVSGGVRLTVQWLPAEPGAKAGAIARADARPFGCGDRVRAVVRLLPPETYRDPGGFSRVGYLLGQGITSTASVSIDRIERTGHSAHETLACRASALQHRASAQLLQIPAAMRGMPKLLRLSEDDAILLAAMVTGDRTYLDRSLRSGFERTGSFHMLVVSGFHLAIAAAIVFWLARRLRLPRVAATLATVGASFAYALFTGFATPVQRSLWMVALYLLGRLIYRQRSHMNTIGFAALCLLAASPRSLFDSGFQMTLLAVVSIAGVAAPLLAGSIHPYLAAMRTLRLVAIDSKLEPRVAQFRVLMRASAEALQLATERERGSRICVGPVSVCSARHIALCGDGRGCLRGGVGHGLSHGGLLPSHYAVRTARQSVYSSTAAGSDAGGAADLGFGDDFPNGGNRSGDGDGASTTLRRMAGWQIWIAGSGRRSRACSAGGPGAYFPSTARLCDVAGASNQALDAALCVDCAGDCRFRCCRTAARRSGSKRAAGGSIGRGPRRLDTDDHARWQDFAD